MDLRKKLKYPPYCDIILIRFHGSDLQEIQKLSQIVYQKIKHFQNENICIYEPVSSPIDKIKNRYRWRIVIKCKVTSRILDIIQYAIGDTHIQKAKNTSVLVDINPTTMQ